MKATLFGISLLLIGSVTAVQTNSQQLSSVVKSKLSQMQASIKDDNDGQNIDGAPNYGDDNQNDINDYLYD